MKKSVQFLRIVFNGDFLNAADSPAGDNHGEIVLSDRKRNRIILQAGNGAVNTSDCTDTVTCFQIIQHFLNLLVLFPLRSDQHEPEYNKYQDKRKECGGQSSDRTDLRSFTFNGCTGSGSFFSNGLKATQDKVYEPVLGLDVEYEGSHGEWFDPDVYAEQPYMSFGVRTDNQLRVSLNGQTLENAYAVGQLLSGASPIKSGCTGGVSAVSAVYVAELINQQ